MLEWDALEARGLSQPDAFAALAKDNDVYDKEMLDTLKNMHNAGGGGVAPSCAVATAPRELKPGMVLAEDLVRKNGVVILPRGFEIDRGLLDHILTFADELKGGSVRVYVP